MAHFLSGSVTQTPYTQLEQTIPIVLFDSRLGDLYLPIVQPPTPSRRLFFDPVGERTEPARTERVDKFVERYFEWVGIVVEIEEEEEGKP